MAQPNILHLHAHDAGRWVQPYGYPVETPHLQNFARQGVLFRKAYCAAPTCGPSRSALMTGQHPHQCGVLGLPGHDGWRIDDYSKHLVHTLNAAGYLTALAGCQHEHDGRDLTPLGYQRLLNDATRPMRGWFYPETIDRVESFLAEDHSHRPFFLSVGLDEPHRNNLARPEAGIGGESARFSKTRYYDPAKLDARHVAPPPWLPDLPEIRRDFASYREGVRIMDEYMGRVLTALEQRGLAENTLVIITTDHGIEFPGSKKTLSDQGLGVMLMLRGPGGFSGGRVIEPLVTHLDLYPTILEVIGLPRRPWLSGRSLGPLVRGEVTTLHEAIFAEQTYHGGLEALRGIRTERHKLILRHDSTGPRMKQDGPSTAVMAAAGYYDRTLGHEELFDLYLDPQEACNRAADPAYATVLAGLRERLHQWMRDTDDCFPSGNFPPKPNS
jgi:N-sulfoglucosamine sulfohydrolase